MPWAEITRRDDAREGLRHASDSTDEEWAIVAPVMPARSKVGHPRTTDLRAVWDAIQYMAATGCQWAMLAKDVPPFTTVRSDVYMLRNSGMLDLMNDAPASAAPAAGRPRGRADGGHHRQPVGQDHAERRAEGLRRRQADQGVRQLPATVSSRTPPPERRHIVTDTQGNLLAAMTRSAERAGPGRRARRHRVRHAELADALPCLRRWWRRRRHADIRARPRRRAGRRNRQAPERSAGGRRHGGDRSPVGHAGEATSSPFTTVSLTATCCATDGTLDMMNDAHGIRPAGGRPRGRADGGHHRQPVGQDHAERRAASTPARGSSLQTAYPHSEVHQDT